MVQKDLEINQWWLNFSGENYWMEITQRPDIGSDLKAPQFSNDGKTETYSYSLMKYVSNGDIVFHYFKKKKSIIGYSVVDGTFYEDDIVWAALGSSALRDNTKPYHRAGWKVGLRNFQALDTPITLSQLRQNSGMIFKAKKELENETKGAVYFPFSFTEKNIVHGAVQGYLVKFPKGITQNFEALRDLSSYFKPEITQPVSKDLGTNYRYADEAHTISKRKPFEVDPDVVDRGSKAHKKIQNDLADYLYSNGISPESPKNNRINFDISWWKADTYFIGEIKSITNENEEKQLRLGLGQILRYISLVDRKVFPRVVAVLIVEKLDDLSWYQTCSNNNVTLVTAKDYEHLIKL